MKSWFSVLTVGVLIGSAATSSADDDSARQKRSFKAELVGLNEVPSISTPARGQFRAVVNESGTGFTFWLSYSGLSFDAAQSHIHFGQHHTNGGISVWLCQATVVAPASVVGRVATCAPRATTTPITGTITAEDVIGPAGQGIGAMEFGELLAAIRAGSAYVNVHSGVGGATPIGFPGGEIRGQIH